MAAPGSPLPDEHAYKLAQKLVDGHLALFVGAGLSHLAPAKDGSDRRLPLWRRLAELVAHACHAENSGLTEILDLFDWIASDQERGTLERAIADILDDNVFDLAPAHRSLAKLPWRAVITTNYDGLLTRLLEEEAVAREEDYDRLAGPRDSLPRLFQIHGTRLNVHTLTREDYRLWESKHPRAALHVHGLLETGTILFVGYSLSDPHLDSILAKVRAMTRGREKRLYAWMWQMPEAGIRLLDRRDKIEVISIERERDWHAAFEQLVAVLTTTSRGVKLTTLGIDPFAYDRAQYLAAIEARYSAANLQGLYISGTGYARDDIRLNDVFIEPHLQLRGDQIGPVAATDSPSLRDLRAQREGRIDDESQQKDRTAMASFLGREPRSVIVGAPGQGKSTLLRAWLLRRTKEWQSAAVQPFPFLLRLAEWEGWAGASNSGLLSFLRSRVGQIGEIGSNALDTWLQGPVLWLLDGVDEIRDTYERQRLREEVLAQARLRPLDHWVLTTRPISEPLSGWAEAWAIADLSPLSDAQVQAILRSWARVLAAKEGLDLDAREMAQRLRQDSGLRALRENPLLLTLAVLFYKSRRRLPRDRWEFLSAAEEVLRDSWVHHRVRNAADHLPGTYLPTLLERLALIAMQEGLVLFSRARLEQEAATHLAGRGYSGAERDREGARLVRAAEDLIGVVVAQGRDAFGFLHLTFQEFLAARALVHRSADVEAFIARYWDHPDWEQVWTLYALGVDADPDRSAQLHNVVLESGHPIDDHLQRPRLWSLRLAGTGTSPLTPPALQSMSWARACLSGFQNADWAADQVLLALRAWERAIEPQLLRPLLQLLRQRDPGHAAAAARALGTSAGVPEVRTALLDCLNHRQPSIRLAALAALADSLMIPEVRAALLECVRDRDPGIRAAAVTALASAATQSDVREELLRLLNDNDQSLRSAAIGALASSATEPDVCDVLLSRLRDSAQPMKVRSSAAEALAFAVAQPGVVHSLIECLKADHFQLRWSAVGALASAATEPAVRDGLLASLNDVDYAVRSRAVGCLASVTSQPKVQEALIGLLNDRDHVVRWNAVRALGSAAPQPLVRDALLRCLDRSEPAMRTEAISALRSAASDPVVCTALIRCLEAPDSDIRARAAGSLAVVAALPDVKRALLRGLGDRDPWLRSRAAAAMAGIAEEPDVRSALLRCFNDGDLHVQMSAARSLIGVTAQPEVWTTFLTYLAGHRHWGTPMDAELRILLVNTLAPLAILEPYVRDELLRCLSDENPLVRSSTATALMGSADNPQVRWALVRRCFGDPDSAVRSATAGALAAGIVREKFGEAQVEG